MMRATEAKDAVLEALGATLGPRSFKLQKGYGFVRKLGSPKQGTAVRETVSVPFYERPAGYEFTLMACSRFESVEDLFHLYSGSPTPKYQAMSHTVMVELDQFTSPASFTVANEVEIRNAVDVLVPVLNDRVMPFFEAHRTISDLDRLANRPNRLDNTLHPSRGMHAVILAHLAGNPKFDELVAKYAHEMLTGPVAGYVHNYDLLVAHLRTLRQRGAER